MEITDNSENKGKLYIVSTPIGNKDDISLRAINTIKRCDIVVCEEMKMGALTLKNLNLAKELVPLNENNESEMTMELLNLLKAGKKLAMISDAGTPIFADPGLYLLKSAISNNIDVEVVPGASSIMTAIVRSGFELYEFLYAGFLPRKNEDRDRKLAKLARERRTVVIFETPYRLHTILDACASIMPDRRVYLGMNLTMPFETHHYGTFSELVKKFENSKIKSEFVIVMEANKDWIQKPIVETTDEDYDDDDDDEPVEYEYPVKAHIKQVQDRRDNRTFKKGFAPKKSNNKFLSNSQSGSRGSYYKQDGGTESNDSNFNRSGSRNEFRDSNNSRPSSGGKFGSSSRGESGSKFGGSKFGSSSRSESGSKFGGSKFGSSSRSESGSKFGGSKFGSSSRGESGSKFGGSKFGSSSRGESGSKFGGSKFGSSSRGESGSSERDFSRDRDNSKSRFSNDKPNKGKKDSQSGGFSYLKKDGKSAPKKRFNRDK